MTQWSANALSDLAARVAARSDFLRSAGTERVAETIDRAVSVLLDERNALGRQLRQRLLQSTGLSEPMIQWGINSTLGSADRAALLRIATQINQNTRGQLVPARLAVVILAGNIFTAALRALALPLLAGVPVVAKASEADDAFPRAFKQALEQSDSAIGACCEVVTFGGERSELLDALFRQAEVVAVYGSDQTVAAVSAKLPPQVRLVAHGHGLGAIYVPKTALSDETGITATIRSVAFDVAAYDQRGCLSPHVVLVEPGGAIDGNRFAERLAYEGLERLQHELPRGHLPIEAGAAQLQWRGVAAARGLLFQGDGYAASFEADAELRPSPGYRNIGVYECQGLDALNERLRPFALHLKALGVAGNAEQRHRVARALKPPLAPRVCSAGAMQMPPFDALADGFYAWTGLVRSIEID